MTLRARSAAAAALAAFALAVSLGAAPAAQADTGSTTVAITCPDGTPGTLTTNPDGSTSTTCDGITAFNTIWD